MEGSEALEDDMEGSEALEDESIADDPTGRIVGIPPITKFRKC